MGTPPAGVMGTPPAGVMGTPPAGVMGTPPAGEASGSVAAARKRFVETLLRVYGGSRTERDHCDICCSR